MTLHTRECPLCQVQADGSYLCYWAQSYHCDCDNCGHTEATEQSQTE
jgi:hypothetical protein